MMPDELVWRQPEPMCQQTDDAVGDSSATVQGSSTTEDNMTKDNKGEQEFSEARRRMAIEQALANSRIEGHVASPEHLEMLDEIAKGRLTFDQAREILDQKYKKTGDKK